MNINLFNHSKQKRQKQLMEQSIDELQIAQKEKLLELQELNSKIQEKANQIQKLQQEYSQYFGIIEMTDLGIEYTPIDATSSEIELKINEVEKSLAQLLSEKKAVTIYKQILINNSESQGNKLQKAYINAIIFGFNTYFSKKCKSITKYNYYHSVDLINSSFEKYDSKLETIGAEFNGEYLAVCLELLKLSLDKKLIIQEEREKLRKEKQILKEQELLLEEAEKERIKLAKERKMYQDAFAKAISDEERTNFEAKLKEIDKREADIDYRINNQRAGYLYLAVTKSMPGLVKIGATRMLNPLSRLAALSSASVPFPFECRGFVFSDDVFSLEKSMHDKFDRARVGATKHKEFFKISPKEAIEVLRNEFKCQVHFTQEENFEEI